jgi:hypothetical protein
MIILVLKLSHSTQIHPLLIAKYPFYPSPTSTHRSLLAVGEPAVPSAPHYRCRLHEGWPSNLAACCPTKSTTPAPPPASAGADLRRSRGGGRPWTGCGRAQRRRHEAPAPSQGRTTHNPICQQRAMRRNRRRVKRYLAIDQG